MFRIIFLAALSFVGACAAAGEERVFLESARYKLTIQSEAFGPLETVVDFSSEGGVLLGRSSSAALGELRAMTQAADTPAVLTLQLRAGSSGRDFSGEARGLDFVSPVHIRLAEGALEGVIETGPLAGAISGAPWALDAPLRDYPAVIAAMDATLPQVIFDPHVLETPSYRVFRERLAAVAASARDDLDVLYAARLGWDNTAFSHYGLMRESSQTIVAAVNAGAGPTAELRYEGEIAILRINTFLSDRAAEEIDAAIAAIAARNPRALIVDLRATPGGSLASKNLIQGLIGQAMPMGHFTGNAWWRSHNAPPNAQDIAERPADTFDNPESALQTFMQDGLLPVEVRPAAVRYAGPLFVLIDAETVSVAELAAATLGGSGRAVLVGERTAGELLTADTVPLVEGFYMMTPLGDYADARLGRIEGIGVSPHHEAPSRDALDLAMRLARSQ
jgi:carboxyl-terminal processing protease